MNTEKIQSSEIADLRISSLPSRPTAPASFGGKGYTATDMKAAFDRLPLFLVDRLNSLISDVQSIASGEASFHIDGGSPESRGKEVI